ncbi:hypothetical protein [Leptothoe sp. PORK10 BA2]|uniref:hypothetical protein n=1 Tax=Leptothoe sp. PORK10 BA2 TaxID=3110254 RepID=UPI002B216D40|nr:hypothetical protein [Leptothoe sp. PORK10 BA2]MEA5467229.1 hypothetical protein [Leptothoe sp. PORK10 BA2]
MTRAKQSPIRSTLTPRPKSTYTTGKFKSFRQLPYHIALSQAARLEAWTEEVQGVGGPAEATNSDDFDPNLMERQ